MSTYIEELIAQLSKSAAESDKDEKDKKDEKSDKTPPFFKKKSDDKDDDDDKKADKKKGDDKDDKSEKSAAELQIDELFAIGNGLSDDMKKLAAAEAQAQFFADLARQTLLPAEKVAAQPAVEISTADLFNAAFEEKIAAFAAQDPAYAQAIAYENVKAAFNQGFYDATEQIKAQLNLGKGA